MSFPKFPGKFYGGGDMQRHGYPSHEGARSQQDPAKNTRALDEFMKSITQNVPADGTSNKNKRADVTELTHSPKFKESLLYLQDALDALIEDVVPRGMPVFSSRYAGSTQHESSLAAVLGYGLPMLFNQNNVAFEASPLTTAHEMAVMSNIEFLKKKNSENVSDGNASSVWDRKEVVDGSVANLHAIWAARNVKYYPLSLRMAMYDNPALDKVASSFRIQTFSGTEKLFCACSPWELLNISPSTIEGIPAQLADQFQIAPEALYDILEPFTVQTLGVEKINSVFGIEKPPQFLVPFADRKAWEGACALAGLGSSSVVSIGTDANDDKADFSQLEALLDDCVMKKQAVYSVGGTYHVGSLDDERKAASVFHKRLDEKHLAFMLQPSPSAY